MKLITDLSEANALLKSYKGADAKIAFYTESLRRIAIRITLHKNLKILYLIGGSCESLSGRFSISNVDFLITKRTENENVENLTVIKDEVSGFELITSDGFVLAQGMESEFGTSFSDFIKDKK